VGARLNDTDEGTHAIGGESNWNESRYIDFWDARQRVGGWFRMGNRPNEGHAEMSACVDLPDGRTAFMFKRVKISGNTLTAGDLSWEIHQPWRANRVRYQGEIALLEDPWLLIDPKKAFGVAPRTMASIDLVGRSSGLDTVMGSDQDHIDRIFLPGQAAFHYQHLCHTIGTVRIGDEQWTVSGGGGKDHSWGPRNWHAKIYLRWLIAAVDDNNGFVLVRGVGPTKKTRSGFVLDRGAFHLVDDFEMKNVYADAPHYELRQVELKIHCAGREWRARGTPQRWLPLRHLQKNAQGESALLRIVKSPAEWRLADGSSAEGMLEYHDLMIDGRPVGLHD